MYRESATNRIKTLFNREGIPVTLAIMLINVLVFFLIYGMPSLNIGEWLAFTTPGWLHRPWTLITWPLITGGDPLNLVFALGWFWTFGSSLERSWGTIVYARFLLAVAALMAVSVWIASFFLGAGVLYGLWIVAGPAIFAWGAINRREQMSLFFIPLPTPALLLLAAAIVWYHAGAALIGLFPLTGCAAAWWYATEGRYPGNGGGFLGRMRGNSFGKDRGDRTQNDRFRNFDREVSDKRNSADILGRLRDEKERRRRDRQLEDMFRRSGFDEPEDDAPRGKQQ